MAQRNIEERLVDLATHWPVPSVVDSVMARIETLKLAGAPRRRPRRLAAIASAAAVLLAAATWFWAVATPRTLRAQVEQAIEAAETVHIGITAIDDGVRRHAEMWYSRVHGLRAEAPDEIIIDDGTQQLSWRPGAQPAIVNRRPGGNAISMIAQSLQLENVPSDWARLRAAEFDREVNGVACNGYLVTPPAPNMVRFVLLMDPQQRIAAIIDQRQTSEAWELVREITINYDATVGVDKFTATLPAGARVVDAEQVLEQLLPLDDALSTTEADGLLFAVHDARRVTDDMYFIVSSVRGTADYLQEHPPKTRRLNLQTTVLDVANQPGSPGNGDGYNRATLATAESEGVHYLWWLAVKRRYFSVEDGVETVRFDDPNLEAKAGRLRLSLQAIRRADPSKWITAPVEVELPSETLALEQVAGRVRGELLTIMEVGSIVAAMHGGIGGEQLRFLTPDGVTDADYAEAIHEQLAWLHRLDEVAWPPAVLSGSLE
jgi:hypothetical protein